MSREWYRQLESQIIGTNKHKPKQRKDEEPEPVKQNNPYL